MDPVERIKERLNIADVVSMYVKLEPAGKNFKAKSPFSGEKTASFFVSPDKGLFKDFSSGKGGDVFTFVQEMEGLDFKGALKFLAEKAGIDLSQYNKKDGAQREEKETLYLLMEESLKFFQKQMNEKTIAYLKERGLEEKTIELFRVGFAPTGWINLYDHLRNKGFNEIVLKKAGLIKQKEGGGFYDVFRNRIIFPIFDSSGRPIAFSGRIFGEDLGPKYLNSPDTPIFKKSDTFFGINFAKEYIRKYDFTIMAEGQMDLIMLHQVGLRNAVAVSGTALTDSLTTEENTTNSFGIINRLSKNILIAFDSDEAGLKATRRAAEIAIRLGMDVKVASLPPGEDPADVIKVGGLESFKKVIKEAKTFFDFYTDKIIDQKGDQRKTARILKEELLPLVLLIDSKMERSIIVKNISEKIQVDEVDILRDLDDLKREDRESLFKEKETAKKVNILEKTLSLYYYLESNQDQKELFEDLKIDLERILGEEKLRNLEEENKDKKDELVFEAEVFFDPLMVEELKIELTQNLEQEILEKDMILLKKEIIFYEKNGPPEKLDLTTKIYQDKANRLNEIRSQRYISR